MKDDIQEAIKIIEKEIDQLEHNIEYYEKRLKGYKIMLHVNKQMLKNLRLQKESEHNKQQIN